MERLQWSLYPWIYPCQHTYCMYTNTHISISIYTLLLLWVGNRDRDIFVIPPSLSLCIFLFIFIPLFEVVITLRVSFDALMNRLFSCDALENGNYDSLSFSFTVFLTSKHSSSTPRSPPLLSFWLITVFFFIYLLLF